MKLSDLAGVKTFKSWGDYFGSVTEDVSKIHNSVFHAPKTAAKVNSLGAFPGQSILPGHKFVTPTGAPVDSGKTLSGMMTSMRNNSTPK